MGGRVEGWIVGGGAGELAGGCSEDGVLGKPCRNIIVGVASGEKDETKEAGREIETGGFMKNLDGDY